MTIEWGTASQQLIGSIIALSDGIKAFTEVKDYELEEPWRTYYMGLREYWRTHPTPDFNSYLIGVSEEEPKRDMFIASQDVPTTDMDQLIEAVKNSYLVRKARKIGTDLMSSAEREDIRNLSEELCDTLNDTDSDVTYDMEGLFFDYLRAQEEKPNYIKIGLPEIDAHTFLEAGDYVVIAGRPSSGKTAYSLQMMLRLAEQGIPCVYFSLETSPKKLYSRIMANYTGVLYDKIKSRTMTDEELGYQIECAEKLNKLPIMIKSASGRDADYIRTEAIKLNAKAIFVDYLQLLKGTGKRDDRYTIVTNNSMALHTLAQSKGITVIALSQLNRPQRQGEEPGIHNLRESGQIEADADLIQILWNEKGEQRTAVGGFPSPVDPSLGYAYWVKTVKNKEGTTGSVAINFIGEQQRFTEYDVYHEEFR